MTHNNFKTDFLKIFNINRNKLKQAKKIIKNKEVYILKIENNTVLGIVNEKNKAFKISIKFKPFTQKQKQIIINSIDNSYEYTANLLNNTLSNQFIQELSSQRILLIPKKESDIEMNCDCNLKISPCKHIIAVILLLSEIINNNPFLLFKLYGLDIIKEIPFFNNYEGSIKQIKILNEVTNDDLNFIEDIDKLNNVKKLFNKIPNLKEDLFEIIKTNIIDQEEYSNFIKKLYKISSSSSKVLTNFNFHFGNDYNHALIFDKNKDYGKLDTKKETKNEFLERIFNEKWNNPYSWKQFKIDVNENYEIKSIDVKRKTYFKNKHDLELILLGFIIEFDNCDVNKLPYFLQFLNLIKLFTLTITQKYAFLPDLYKNNNENIQIRFIPNNNDIINEIITILSSYMPDNLLTINGKKVSKIETINILINIIIKSIITMELYYTNPISSKNLYIKNKVNDEYFMNGLRNFLIKTFTSFTLTNKHYEIYLIVNEENSMFSIDLKIKFEDDNKYYNIEEIFKSDNPSKYEIFLDIQTINNYLNKEKILINKKYWIDFETFNKIYKNIFPLLKKIGIKIELPNSFNKITKPKLKIKLKKNVTSSLTFSDIANFDWKIAVGNTEYTIEEFEKLVEKSKNIIKSNNEIIILNNEINYNFLKKYNEINKKLNKNELLQLLLTSRNDKSILIDKNLNSFLDDITSFKNIPIPQNVNASLREYQKIGFSWILQNMKAGFGSILADDMGLGKTLEILTTIVYLKENNLITNKILIICPTSLLTNWQKEIEKFTPCLSSFIYHGQNRTLPKEDYDIILTSFGMIRQDIEILNSINWFLIVVDEAQNIKNSRTLQTLSIKALKSNYKIALTGTPVENNLSEYWSIFDFVNPDYLGSEKSFKRDFTKPIQEYNDENIIEKFKLISSPFILRRMKTDKNIIKNLPDKIVNDIYCNLTETQAAIYQEVLNESMKKINTTEGISRKGNILKLITSLKQICNHPSQYSKSKIVKIKDSGKLAVLINILENIIANNEKTLIFTQYVQMGEILEKVIDEKFNCNVSFLHGSQTRKQKDELINNFQNDDNFKIFIISLKAGGTGLNLTAAQNVIHYDLWWNPAVENQATDRAYRIGQNKNVMVYRFITSGTFEENINQMIKEKEELAEKTISKDNKFITELSNDELKEIFKLKY